MRRVPKEEKEEEAEHQNNELSDRESANELHPECPPFQAFRYKAGKPDRVKKVVRFMRDEEEKVLSQAQR